MVLFRVNPEPTNINKQKTWGLQDTYDIDFIQNYVLSDFQYELRIKIYKSLSDISTLQYVSTRPPKHVGWYTISTEHLYEKNCLCCYDLEKVLCIVA